MEENQNGWNSDEAPRTYGEESKLYESGQMNQNQQGGYGQNPYGQPGYGNGQNPYGQPAYGYNPNGGWQGNMNPQMQHGAVPDVFCNILLVIMVVRVIIGFFIMQQTFGAIDDYSSIINGSYLSRLMGGAYQALSLASNLLFVAMIIFVVLDIVQINKARYKITGLILFAIFLNPGYYIWRAHILGRKKTFPIIYTVVYGALQIAYFIYTFYMSFSMAFEMTQSMF